MKPKPVRVQITIDPSLLERLDKHAINRSAYIAHAVRRALEAEGAKPDDLGTS